MHTAAYPMLMIMEITDRTNSVEFPNAIHPSVGFIPKGGFLVHLF